MNSILLLKERRESTEKDREDAKLNFTCHCKYSKIIDPLGQPTAPAGSGHYFRTYFRLYVRVRTSVPIFQNITKQNKRQMKIMIDIGGTMGLAKGIVDGTCLVIGCVERTE